jgi:hypothetical protein
VIGIVIVLGVMFFPSVWNATAPENLRGLQSSQDWNAADATANLSLERVDYSTRENIVVNLPTRMFDIISRPYPWQVGNASQQLGLLGTVFMFGGILLLISTLSQNGGALMRRAGPLIYPAIFLLIAYSLSAGNAGTAFRYRTHLVAFLLALICTLRATRAERRPAVAPRPAGRLKPMIPQPATRSDEPVLHA